MEPLSISITLGEHKQHLIWDDRRDMMFDQFGDMLTSPLVGPKDGPCYTPAIFREPRRKRDYSDVIGMAVLDADCGHTADEIINAIEARGWGAIVHSTHSHLTADTQVARSSYHAWQKQNGGRDDVAAFMLEKKGYLPRVLDGARIAGNTLDNYAIDHQPCPKFRVVIPLAKPWRAADFPSQKEAEVAWAERIGALAAALDLHHDQSCIDTSRLFFFPRLRDAEQPFFYEWVDGELCDIWALPKAKVAAVAEPDLLSAPQYRPAPAAQAHLIWRGDDGAEIDLTSWAADKGPRFELATAIRKRSPSVIGDRKAGVKLHIRCPFLDEHTEAGDKGGTFVVNASDIGAAGLTNFTAGFFVGCKHSACTGRDRLEFLRKMLDRNLLAVADLSEFLTPEPPAVDSSAFMARIKAHQTAKEKKEPGNIPSRLIDTLPGPLGDFIKYTLETSPKPQPIMALGSALATMSVALGQRVMLDGWLTRPNVYIGAIAGSGYGKERPLSAAKDILRRAGLLKTMTGAEKIKSEAGLMTQIAEKPCHVMLMDEIGHVLSMIGDRNSGVHMKEVVPALLTLYSSSHTLYKGGAYADPKRNQEVEQPCVSIFGPTTPDVLFDALRLSDIKSGLLSRLVIFDVGEHDPKEVEPKARPVPDSLVEWFSVWRRQTTSHTSGDKDKGNVQTIGYDMAINPRPVEMAAGVRELFTAFRDEMYDAKHAAKKDGLDALFVRPLQNAMKFALIRACARILEPSKAEVTIEDAAWAIEVSRCAVNHMATIARDCVFDSQYQRHLATFRKVIKAAGPRGLTKADLSRIKQCQIPEREEADVLKRLTTSGEVREADTNAGRVKSNGVKVKARNAYVWAADLPPNEDDDE